MARNAFNRHVQDDMSGPAQARHLELCLTSGSWERFAQADAIARWDALANWASEPNPFFESWYLLPSLRALDPEGRVQIVALEADGVLAGLMPIRREWSYYGRTVPHWRNWVHENCFLGAPLVARNFELPFWRALLAWADEDWNRSLLVHLSHIPLSGRLYEALKQAQAERPRHQAALVHTETRAMLQGGMPSEAYLESALTSKKRKELRRQHKRLAELGKLAMLRQTDRLGIGDWIEDFLALEQSGWKGKAGSALASNAATRAIFADALEAGAEHARLERLTLALDGRPIAMLANFVAGDASFSYKTAFAEDYARFSPGVLLQLENLKQLDRAGFAWSDSCASEDHPMIERIWREKRVIGRINAGIGGPLRRAIFAAMARAEAGSGGGALP